VYILLWLTVYILGVRNALLSGYTACTIDHNVVQKNRTLTQASATAKASSSYIPYSVCEIHQRKWASITSGVFSMCERRRGLGDQVRRSWSFLL